MNKASLARTFLPSLYSQLVVKRKSNVIGYGENEM